MVMGVDAVFLDATFKALAEAHAGPTPISNRVRASMGRLKDRIHDRLLA